MLNISIVTYKVDITELLLSVKSCLRSDIVRTVYIIDNSPTDECSAALANFEHLKYIHNPENTGYGAAHNLALTESIKNKLDYHLVLNADVLFEGAQLAILESYMNLHPLVGLASPKVYLPNGEIQRLCKLVPTPFDLFLRRFLPKSIMTQSKANFELAFTGYSQEMFVPYLSGCFMFLRVEALKDIGIFDERFFMYPEDIDLTRRLALRWDTMFLPSVSVTHQYGAASHKSLRIFAIHFWNLIKYFNKWGWLKDSGRDQLNQRTLSQFVVQKE